jgi:hypothetical protein
MTSRENFLHLIGRVRANGSFPDEPLLAVYDALSQQVTEAQAEVAKLETMNVSVVMERANFLLENVGLTARLAEVTKERDDLEHRLTTFFVHRNLLDEALKEIERLTIPQGSSYPKTERSPYDPD